MRRSFWDIAYHHGDEREHWDAPRPPQELERWIGEGLVAGRVLDVGCGTGTELLHVAGRAPTGAPDAGHEPMASRLGSASMDLWGIDRSLTGLARARRRPGPRATRIRWTAADATRLPLRDACVDVVLDRGCLHVVSRRLRRAYAREMARVTRPGGRLLVRGARHRDIEAGFESLPPAEIEHLFGASGFDMLSVEPIRLEARAEDLEGWAYCLQRGPERSPGTEPHTGGGRPSSTGPADGRNS